MGSREVNLFYDDNNISIDGEVGPWFNENVASRFKSYGWNVLGPIDGHDVFAIKNAIDDALSDKENLLIWANYHNLQNNYWKRGTRTEGTAKAHGEPWVLMEYNE